MRFSTPFKKALAGALCCACSSSWAQQASIEPVRPEGPLYKRPYLAAEMPPARLGNSGRFAGLLRGGNLYLSARDAIALALENNIDLEVSRYNFSMLEWRLERSQAGGALPGVPSGASQASSVTSGQGVLGSQQAAGVGGGNSGGNGAGGNTTVSQIGPVTQTLDPAIQESTAFSHRSLPQPNATQSVTPVLVPNQRAYTGSYQEGLITGGSVTVSYSSTHLNENAPTDVLNPSVAASASISINHNLLQNFGARVGGRNIQVAKMNLAMSDTTFRNQVERTIGTVLSAYWKLVGDTEDRKAKQTSLDTAQRFLGETKRRLELGAVANLDVTTAENQVASAILALVNSDTSVEQDEVQLKNLLSRTGLEDREIAGAHIVPLDRIEIPEKEELPDVAGLARKALKNRPDLAIEEGNLRTAEVSNIGTRNGLLPVAQVIASRSNAGQAGTPRVVRGQTASPYFFGGSSNALAQIARQDFPSENAAVGGRVVFENRQAQADFGIDQLSLRQQELGHAKSANQVQVDVMNAVVALRQARARHEAAVEARILQERLLDAERKKLAAGESTTYNVTQQQRDLATAASTELASLVSYQTARIAIDQTTGSLMEANGISLSDAKSGKVAKVGN